LKNLFSEHLSATRSEAPKTALKSETKKRRPAVSQFEVAGSWPKREASWLAAPKWFSKQFFADMAGLGLFYQKNAIAATTPIATALKFFLDTEKMGS
jgi:hypothetical protein